MEWGWVYIQWVAALWTDALLMRENSREWPDHQNSESDDHSLQLWWAERHLEMHIRKLRQDPLQLLSNRKLHWTQNHPNSTAGKTAVWSDWSDKSQSLLRHTEFGSETFGVWKNRRLAAWKCFWKIYRNCDHVYMEHNVKGVFPGSCGLHAMKAVLRAEGDFTQY